MRRLGLGAVLFALTIGFERPSAAQSPPVPPPMPAPVGPAVVPPVPAIVPPVDPMTVPLPGAPGALSTPPGFPGPPVAPPGVPPPPGTVPSPLLPPDLPGTQAPGLRHEVLERPRTGGTVEDLLQSENIDRVIFVAGIVVVGGVALVVTMIRRRRGGA